MSFELYASQGNGTLPDFQRNKRINDPKLYQPSKELVNSVNVALALGQPLLLTGEPGTGKTQLAYHIAHFFSLGKPVLYNAQTTSTATDLFYQYDALRHFQYAQNQTELLSDDEVEKRFVDYSGRLGEAILANRRMIVLIDEIDKAPRDFPNNLLAAIEDMTFTVPEIGKTHVCAPAKKPIIIITSNSEKNLPDPFLRRVVFYHIPFPDSALLLRILKAKVATWENASLEDIVTHFNDIRDGKYGALKKKPATAELIGWASLLNKIQFDTKGLANVKGLSTEDKNRLKMSYSVLAKNKDDLRVLIESIEGRRRTRR
jgi:MoxR-like ATPase